MNIFSSITTSFCFSLLFVFAACSQEELVTPTGPNTPTPPVVMENDDFMGSMRDLSSADLVGEMGIGWNLGNSFDVRDKDKTAWGNPLTTSTHIRMVKDMGFETLRIPVTWNYHQQQNAPYTIETPYLARVKLIVDEGLKNDMHVIINTHHDDWIIPTTAEAATTKARLTSLWTQVGNYFQEYGDKLIFEVMNEPRLMGSPEEWSGGTQEGRDVLNEYHKVCVDAIRNTGGNNSKRHLMVSTYAASTTSDAMNDLIIPNDDPNIIISLHSYFPWSFAGQEDGTNIWGSEEEKTALTKELDWIRDKWISQEGRAVILGEWGTTDKNNLTARKFGMYNRNTNTWKYPAIAQAVVAAGK